MRTRMPNQQKVEKVAEIKERLQAAQAAYFADYRGLSVPDIGEVRTALVEVEAQFAVLKNTLTRLAVRDLELSELEEFLEGPTAVAFVQGDIVAGAKALVDASKRFPVLEVKGGLAEGRVLGADEIKALAALETREEMLAKIAGLLSMHMRQAAFLLEALQSKFAALLAAYREKLEEETPAEEPAEQEETSADQAEEESDEEQEEG
ncbi:MAG TPA: 50S ribosomal protein L10 [Actinomycetota bacterium]|nr:50S ribosomal protein L10 [Actinomycetota bacterium]